ncbi:MAG: histidine--tRNA ligase [Thermaurantimonas sp.]
MSKIKPALVQGTRDFGPEIMYLRNHVIGIIREVFERYAYQPLETPAMERLETLTGKYGDEGDRLIFKILNSGDFKKDVSDHQWAASDSAVLAGLLCEKALRYDLTVPFSRFVSMNRHALILPFKRYQIQPVWRADRPQKGRYREFYQCDADVVGSSSLWQEVELMLIYGEVFHKLNLPVKIRINSRKLLYSIAQKAHAHDRVSAFVTILDKLDKIGSRAVCDEWLQAGFDASGIGSISSWIFDRQVDIGKVARYLDSENEGIQEVTFVLENVKKLQADTPLHFDPTLARGLDYYTGCIFEVVVEGAEVGSVGGGGRYDNLTGIFGVEGVSGVGISFGLDRIILAIEERGGIQSAHSTKAQVMVTGLMEEDMPYAAELSAKFREEGVRTEFYPSAVKLKKSLDYANKTGIPLVTIVGEEERKNKNFTLKNLITGNQKTFSIFQKSEWLNALNHPSF